MNGHFRNRWIEGTYTMYKAYFWGLCKGISPQNMANNMVQYLHFRILKFPWRFSWDVNQWYMRYRMELDMVISWDINGISCKKMSFLPASREWFIKLILPTLWWEWGMVYYWFKVSPTLILNGDFSTKLCWDRDGSPVTFTDRKELKLSGPDGPCSSSPALLGPSPENL